MTQLRNQSNQSTLPITELVLGMRLKPYGRLTKYTSQQNVIVLFFSQVNINISCTWLVEDCSPVECKDGTKALRRIR